MHNHCNRTETCTRDEQLGAEYLGHQVTMFHFSDRNVHLRTDTPFNRKFLPRLWGYFLLLPRSMFARHKMIRRLQTHSTTIEVIFLVVPARQVNGSLNQLEGFFIKASLS